MDTIFCFNFPSVNNESPRTQHIDLARVVAISGIEDDGVHQVIRLNIQLHDNPLYLSVFFTDGLPEFKAEYARLLAAWKLVTKQLQVPQNAV